MLPRGGASIRFVWQEEAHCTPEKQVTVLLLCPPFMILGASLAITRRIVSNQLKNQACKQKKNKEKENKEKMEYFFQMPELQSPVQEKRRGKIVNE